MSTTQAAISDMVGWLCEHGASFCYLDHAVVCCGCPRRVLHGDASVGATQFSTGPNHEDLGSFGHHGQATHGLAASIGWMHPHTTRGELQLLQQPCSLHGVHHDIIIGDDARMITIRCGCIRVVRLLECNEQRVVGEQMCHGQTDVVNACNPEQLCKYLEQ